MGLNNYDNKKVAEVVTLSLNSVITPQSYAGINSQFYCPYMAINGSLVNGTGLNANVLRAIPFVITRKVKLLEMALYLVSGGKKQANQAFVPKFRYGVYDCNPNTLKPRNLLFQTPEIIINSVNAVYSAANINQEMAAGVYYYSCITQAEQALIFRAISASMQQIVLNFDSMSATTPVNRLEAALNFPAAGLPASFPENPTYLTTASFNPDFFAVKTSPLNLF